MNEINESPSWEERKAKIREVNTQNQPTYTEEQKKSWDLLEKAEREVISQEEIEQVADKIKNKTYKDNVELSLSIRTIGYAGATQYRDLIEKYLDYPEAGFVAKSALNTLCSYWDLAGEYLDKIKLFMEGVEWDTSDEVRTAAFYAAGEYLKDHRERELLKILLDFIDEPVPEETDEYETLYRCNIRGLAYEALVIAMGKDWFAIPYRESVGELIESKSFDLVDMSVVEDARKRLKEEK